LFLLLVFERSILFCEQKKEEEELEGSDSETEGDNSEELDPEMLCGWRSKGI